MERLGLDDDFKNEEGGVAHHLRSRFICGAGPIFPASAALLLCARRFQ
jgi:hypothetical protein